MELRNWCALNGEDSEMVTMVLDSDVLKDLVAERQSRGIDQFDEVWEGVDVMAPMANLEHQRIATAIANVFCNLFDVQNLGETYAGCNISDRVEDWKQNYRCPDVALYLTGTTAIPYDAFWYGGPDFGIEIISPHDRSREKLDFYAKVGTRELLLIDRDPWALELYRLDEKALLLVDTSTLEQPHVLTSQVVPLTWKLVPGESRPQIEIHHADDRQQWSV